MGCLGSKLCSMSNPPGGGSNRTKEQRERDLKRIAELRMQGWLQEAIAREIGVNQQQISRDLKEIRKRWQKETSIQADQMLAEEIALTYALQRIYWEGFEQSKRLIEVKDGKGVITQVPLPGDPRWLQSVERCISQRVKLLGLEPPHKIAPTNPKGDEPYQQSGVLIVEKIPTMEEWLKDSPGYDANKDDPNES